MQIHTACFITNSTIRDLRKETDPTVLESGKDNSKIPKSSAFKTIVKKSSVTKTQKDKDASVKKIKLIEGTRQLQKEVAVPTVSIQNKFSILSNITETDETAASTSRDHAVTSECVMDTNDSADTAVNMSVNAEQVPKKKEPRPPPVTVLGHENLFQTNKELKTKLKKEFKVVNTREGLRYYTATEEDHRTLKEYFDGENRQYYSFQLRSELPLRVMLKRLPKSTDPEEIKAELLHLGYPIRAVKQLTKKENNCEIKLPLYALELENNETAKEIYNLNRLMYTVVSVESYRPRSGLKQCFKCQRFNHTFAGCKLSARCVICAGGHSHKDCPVRQEARSDPSKLKCANCEETGHPASYRGCVSYKAAQENFEKPKKTGGWQRQTKTNAKILHFKKSHGWDVF